jgi:hypothetical protein
MRKVEEYEKTIKEIKQEKCMRDVSTLHNNAEVPKSGEVIMRVENYLNDKSKKMEIKSIK